MTRSLHKLCTDTVMAWTLPPVGGVGEEMGEGSGERGVTRGGEREVERGEGGGEGKELG